MNNREPNFSYTVLRPSFPLKKEIYPEVEMLLNFTEYRLDAKDRDFPNAANCVTLVRHVIQTCFQTQLPHVYLGDLPKALIERDWRVVTVNELKVGDLLFLYSASKRKITHVSVAISTHEVVHCFFPGNCVIDSLFDFTRLRPKETLMIGAKSLSQAFDRRDYFRLAQGLVTLSRISDY